MTCYYPVRAYRSSVLSASGKRPLVYDQRKSNGCVQYRPCGQCSGCRLAKSAEWAARISHEASLYEHNCFITLTYSSEFLPKDGSLHVEHFQLFMKRLRKRFGSKIRFFHCGEYGEQLGRPHYHACLMNFDFPDKWHFYNSRLGDPIYRSPELERLWPFGHCEIGAVTFESAAYVARYVTKKITGKMAEEHYMRVDPDTGEIFQLQPEYTTMSRRPGIASEWFKKFSSDVYPHDAILLPGGKKMPVPRFYRNRYESMEPERAAAIAKRRLTKFSTCIVDQLLDNTPERLKVKEIVHLRTIETLKRNMER